MHQRLLVLSLLLSGIGCMGTNGSYNGQIHGQEFDLADAAYITKFYSADTLGNGTSVTASALVLSTSYNMCNDVTTQRVYPNEQFIIILLGQENTTALAPLDGEYAMTQAEYSQETEYCQPGSPLQATGGSLKFSDGDYAAGKNADATFNISFTSGESGSGNFSATPCGSMETFLDAIVGEAWGGQTSSGPIYLIDGTCS